MKALNKIYNKPGDCIFEVCNKLIRKMTDYLFAIIDEGTALLGNGTLCTVLKEKNTLIKMFSTMYIDFY